MYFNLIITGFKNPRAKTVVARHLAHTPTISLQKALAMVENPPFEYMKDLSVKDLQEQCSQLVKMGILYKVEEVTIQLNESIPTPVPIPQDDEKITIKDLPQESTQHPAIPPPPPTKTFQTVPHILPAEPPAENTLKVRIATVLIAVTLITLFLSLLIIGNRPLKIKTSENFSLVSLDSSSTEKLKKRKQSGLTRKSVSVKAKAESKAFVDSATLYRYEIYKAINFYKIAISFNRYNLQAWYGLIDAYKSAGMNKEMKAAYAEMEKLFGKAAFSIKQIVQNFGDVQDVYRTEDNIYRIEYRSDKNTETELIQETFSIIQAVRPICNCEAISLFSSTSPGYGLMVFVKKDTPIHTSDAFTRNASIQYLK